MLCVGLMSGTSVDAVDAILVDFAQQPYGKVVHFVSYPINTPLKNDLRGLIQPSDNEISQMLIAEQAITDVYIAAVDALLTEANCQPEDVTVIGCHGQTIRHQVIGGQLCTLQIGDMEKLAVKTKIPVVGNFRRRDIALGGQGAPLMPLVHQALWSGAQEDFAVLNLGGIANISIFHKGKCVMGFDTGPGNGLIDAWVQRHWKKPYDQDGVLARSGVIGPSLVDACLEDPYFLQKPPKSTGRDYFHLAWLAQRYPNHLSMCPKDVLASLVELTAQSVVLALKPYLNLKAKVYIAGGGAFNHYLVERLCQQPGALYQWSRQLPGGLNAQQLESYGFAWFAYQHQQGVALDTSHITGASAPCVLGCYSA